jgi:protein-disulfide isomerase
MSLMTDPAEAPGYEPHSRGPADAPVTIVEFGDYQCPYCGRLHPVLKRLVEESNGLVRLVFRNFPLFQLHPYALTAALAVEAAAPSGKFWAMHDLVFANQKRLADADLRGYAESLGIPGDAVVGARAQDFKARVKHDYHDGIDLGVQGTPTLFVNGEAYGGRHDLASLQEAVTRVARESPGSARSA